LKSTGSISSIKINRLKSKTISRFWIPTIIRNSATGYHWITVQHSQWPSKAGATITQINRLDWTGIDPTWEASKHIAHWDSWKKTWDTIVAPQDSTCPISFKDTLSCSFSPVGCDAVWLDSQMLFCTQIITPRSQSMTLLWVQTLPSLHTKNRISFICVETGLFPHPHNDTMVYVYIIIKGKPIDIIKSLW
jgi:hypothetical protein